MKDTAYRVSELRKQMGLTQFELADKLNISRSTIGMIEQGKRTPGRDTLEAMADFFNVSVDYLLCKENRTARLIDPLQKDEQHYYINKDTAELAQKLMENKELGLLFDAAQDAAPEDLETVHQMLLALKRKEKGWD